MIEIGLHLDDNCKPGQGRNAAAAINGEATTSRTHRARLPARGAECKKAYPYEE
jgi:hypothetical protein